MICLGRKGWVISQRRRAPSTFFLGLLLSLACIGIHTKRKEIWFTDNISRITRFLLSHGLVDRVTPIGHKTWGNKLILCLDPKHLVYIDLRAFLAKQVSQDLVHSFSGLTAPETTCSSPGLHPPQALFPA